MREVAASAAAPPPDVGHRTFRMGNSEISDDESNHGPVTDTELEEPAPIVHDISDSDTDIELGELAPNFHAADAEVARIVRRRHRVLSAGRGPAREESERLPLQAGRASPGGPQRRSLTVVE